MTRKQILESGNSLIYFAKSRKEAKEKASSATGDLGCRHNIKVTSQIYGIVSLREEPEEYRYIVIVRKRDENNSKN